MMLHLHKLGSHFRQKMFCVYDVIARHFLKYVNVKVLISLLMIVILAEADSTVADLLKCCVCSVISVGFYMYTS